MLKYKDTMVTFSEVPDEISLCINITNCPMMCIGCHSPELRQDIGEYLDLYSLIDLIDANKDITCVCIMGGDADILGVEDIMEDIKTYYPNLLTAWYSGRYYIPKNIDLNLYDFIKIGSYQKRLGPLNSKTTNQRMYKIIHDKDNTLEDITSKFWK